MAYHPKASTKKRKRKPQQNEGEVEEGEEEERKAEEVYNPNMLLMPLQLSESRRLWLATVEDNEAYTVAYHMDSMLE
jgi:hypothetical protein